MDRACCGLVVIAIFGKCGNGWGWARVVDVGTTVVDVGATVWTRDYGVD